MAEKFDFEGFDREIDKVLAEEGLILEGLMKALNENATECMNQQEIDEYMAEGLHGTRTDT